MNQNISSRIGRALTRLCVGVVLVALAGSTVCAEPMTHYRDAKRLMQAKDFRQAKALLVDALWESKETQDNYFAFFFARDLATCEERGGHIRASIGYALEALELLGKADDRMPAATRVHERLLLEGAMSARYFDSHQISLARQWQRRTNQTLLAYIAEQTGKPYDLKSGVLPPGISKTIGTQIVRQLWHESRILEREARTAEALACLDAAERLLTLRDGRRRDRVEEDYYWKVQNMRGILLDFLGFLPDAIAIDRLCAGQAITPELEYSIQLARLNLSRNLSQYHGASEEYLKDALDACARIEVVGRSATAGQGARRVINKMVFDLTHDLTATQQLAAVEAAFKAAGRQMDAEYTERDRLAIAVQTGTGDKAETEAGLLRLLESFRNNGNRAGEPSLFGTYGAFCFKEGRYEDALYLYTRSYELSKQYGWHVHLPRIMHHLAKIHLRLGDPAGAEQWCRKIQATLLAHPDFPPHRRAEALALVADLLAALGREQEGQAVREKAVADAQTAGVPDFWLRVAEKEGKAETAKASHAASDAPATDLQPRRVVSETRPGETALARLTLANPASGARTGKLLYPASAELLRRDLAVGEIHLLIHGGGDATAEIPLELAASEMIHVFLEASVDKAGTDETVAIRWVPQGGQPQTAEWGYRATQEQADITVVNANLADLNPFYYVPLYHAIRKRDAAARVFDFSVVCSAPCHVEVVDVTTGEVMAVDRQGDGAFDREGDFAFQDSNGNLFPDHAFAEGEALFGIEIRVYPVGEADAAKPDDITVTVMGAFDGQWQSLSENILKKNKTN